MTITATNARPAIPTFRPLAKLSKKVSDKLSSIAEPAPTAERGRSAQLPMTWATLPAKSHWIGQQAAYVSGEVANNLLGTGLGAEDDLGLINMAGRELARGISSLLLSPGDKRDTLNRILLVPFAVPCALGAVVGLVALPAAMLVGYVVAFAVHLVIVGPILLMRRAPEAPNAQIVELDDDTDLESIASEASDNRSLVSQETSASINGMGRGARVVPGRIEFSHQNSAASLAQPVNGPTVSTVPNSPIMTHTSGNFIDSLELGPVITITSPATMSRASSARSLSSNDAFETAMPAEEKTNPFDAA